MGPSVAEELRQIAVAQFDKVIFFLGRVLALVSRLGLGEEDALVVIDCFVVTFRIGRSFSLGHSP